MSRKINTHPLKAPSRFSRIRFKVATLLTKKSTDYQLAKTEAESTGKNKIK